MRLFARASAALTAGLIAVTFQPTAAHAAVSWEKSYAKKIDSLENPVLCNGVEAWYGGSEWEPHYSACFKLKDDLLKVMDAKADGDAAVMKWKIYLPKTTGRGYRTTPSRKGVCIYTGGSTPRYRSGICNKDLPEKGLLQFWAGKRVVSGSTSLADMRFGDPVCLALNGSGALNDPNCDLLDLSGG